jgi:hypothetical protein
MLVNSDILSSYFAGDSSQSHVFALSHSDSQNIAATYDWGEQGSSTDRRVIDVLFPGTDIWSSNKRQVSLPE